MERAKLYVLAGVRLHLADELFDERTLCGLVGYPLKMDFEPKRFEQMPVCSRCSAAERHLV